MSASELTPEVVARHLREAADRIERHEWDSAVDAAKHGLGQAMRLRARRGGR